MGILSVIRAPHGVQLNRVVFTLYGILFTWAIWRFRHAITFHGLLIFESFIFCSLLGLFYSCIRARRSRWILAVLDFLMPAVFWLLMLPVFSRPAWWEWPFVLVMWFSIPTGLVALLFRDKKTSEYFTTQAV
jgi:hypothetical protein